MNHLSASELEQLKALEEDLWKPDTRFDQLYMRKLLSPDFLEYGRSGKIYTLEEVLSIEPRDISITLPLPNLNARQISDDVVQLTYRSIVSSEGEVEYANRSSLWCRNKGEWQLRFHQGTPCNENS